MAQSYDDVEHIPFRAVMIMEEKIACVETINFQYWTVTYVDSVRDLLVGEYEAFLVHYGYRAHISIQVYII